MFYNLLIVIFKVIVKVFFFMEVEGVENVPKEGGAILCPNHISMWDPIACTVAQNRKLAYMAKAEVYNFKLLTWFFKSVNVFPVERDNRRANVKSIMTMENLLREGHALIVFPEGTRVRKGKKSEPKNGAVRMALHTGVPIVPFGINGNFKIFRKVKIKIGEPIFYKEENGEKVYTEQINVLTKELMGKINELAGR